MRVIKIIFIEFAAFLTVFAMRGWCYAQNAPTAFSQYGQIQPVQKYSSNPFWTKDSPYNQRMPTPIYATGADLNTGDCNRIVTNLITSHCTSVDCSNKRISDVRPIIMVQLSQLPGHNFATSCGGYIDGIFENYKKSYGNVSTVNVVKTIERNNNIQLDNLFKKQVGEYEAGVAARTAELDRLQKQTTPTPKVAQKDFPTTAADLSLADRTTNSAAGYEPYKDSKSYRTIKIENDASYLERLKALNPTEFCLRYPQDDFCNPEKTSKKKKSANNDDDDEEEEECKKGSKAECPIVLNLN